MVAQSKAKVEVVPTSSGEILKGQIYDSGDGFLWLVVISIDGVVKVIGVGETSEKDKPFIFPLAMVKNWKLRQTTNEDVYRITQVKHDTGWNYSVVWTVPLVLQQPLKDAFNLREALLLIGYQIQFRPDTPFVVHHNPDPSYTGFPTKPITQPIVPSKEEPPRLWDQTWPVGIEHETESADVKKGQQAYYEWVLKRISELDELRHHWPALRGFPNDDGGLRNWIAENVINRVSRESLMQQLQIRAAFI